MHASKNKTGIHEHRISFPQNIFPFLCVSFKFNNVLWFNIVKMSILPKAIYDSMQFLSKSQQSFSQKPDKNLKICIEPRACCACCIAFVISDSLWLHGLRPTRLLCSWDSPGKDTGVGCHFLLQGIFLTRGSNLRLLCLLHWQAGSLPLGSLRNPHTEPQKTPKPKQSGEKRTKLEVSHTLISNYTSGLAWWSSG